MNAKQSLKAASKRIMDLEDWNNKAKHDIKAYNACIDGVIAGQCSFCDWCEENRLGECENPEKGTGCAEWWLMDNPVVKVPEEPEGGETDGAAENFSKAIFSASPDSGK